MDDENRAPAVKEVPIERTGTGRSRKGPGSAGKRRVLSVSLIVLLAAAAVLIFVLALLRDYPGTGGVAGDFSFEPHTSNVYAAFKGGLVVVSAADATVYGPDGRQIRREHFAADSPAISAGENAVAAYDIGGASLIVFDEDELLFSYRSDRQLIDASVNERSWVAVCETSGEYKGVVTVFDESGRSLYKWYSAQGYVLAASISPNGKYLAVVTLQQKQEVFRSVVSVFALSSEDVRAEYQLEDDVIIDIGFIKNDLIACVSESSLVYLDAEAREKAVYDYDGFSLHNYIIGPDYTVLSLSRTNSGLNGRIVTVDLSGREMGSADVSGTVQCISSGGGRIAALIENSTVLYTSSMKEDGELSSSGAKKVLLTDDGSVLILTNTDAKLYLP